MGMAEVRWARAGRAGSAALLLLAALVAQGQTKGQAKEPARDLAFARAAHLRRGINLSMWYAQDRDLYNATGGAEKLASYINATDFKLVRELGFDHVRLSIDPEPLIANKATGELRPEAMARLDETIRQINAAGLVVIVDVHPNEGWEKAALTDEGIPNFLYFWRGFARHFAGTDPQKVYFEVLNEPHDVSTLRWSSLQARAVAIIRKEAPQHTIIVTGVSYGNIDGLAELDPLPDTNLIYSIHDYEPMVFTHQGATWAGDSLIPLRGVPYPSSPEAVAPLLPGLVDHPSSHYDVEHYGAMHWGRVQMQARIGQAAAWGKQHHVPVWCGEFGALRDYAPPDSRARWIGDMRKTFDQFHMGWAMWDYQGGFGVVIKKDGTTKVDVPIAQALGLNVTP
jgi:aryl-phospho-beta-D-glucosidase BglC (GH1 family)